jgi:hypothetical protein
VGGMPNAGRPSTGGMPSGGRPGTGGVTNAGGVGGAGNASGSGNSAGMGNPGPISKDSLVYWFSADAGVTETGGVISEWLDRSGNETSASQLTVESRPTLGKLGGSDLPAVVFDGLDDHLVLPPLAANFGEGLSYFSVVRAAANDGCKSMLEVSNGSEIEEISFFLHLQAFTYEVGNETIHGQEGAFIAGTPLLLDVTHSYTQGVSLFLNGLGTGTSAFPEPVTTTRNQNFLGRSLYVDCTPWSGEIAELLLYARTLPTEESQAVRLYLTEKWGCCDAT